MSASQFHYCQRYIKSAGWAYVNAQDPQYGWAEDLAVTPTACGRKNAKFDPVTAFSEALADSGGSFPEQSIYLSLFYQFDCHTEFAQGKPYFDLEPWREELASLSDQETYRCNPPPAIVVHGVGIGSGATYPLAVPHHPEDGQIETAAFESELGAAGGPPSLGEPVTPVLPSYGPSGCEQIFNYGREGSSAIVSSDCQTAGVKANWIGGDFYSYWASNGLFQVVGTPADDVFRSGAGFVQVFADGQYGLSILAEGDDQTVVYDVHGPIYELYGQLGGTSSSLGYPTSDQYTWCGLARQDFYGGSIVWDATNGARLLSGNVCGSGAALIPYGDGGYSYEVVPHGDLSRFPTSYDASGFASATAPFSNGGCGLAQATGWPADTDLLAVHSVDVPAGASGLSVSVGIDNDIVVYWDGTQIGADTHEGCASNDSFTYQVPPALAQPGQHQVAFRAIDRGSATYFDATVRAGSSG